MTLAEVFAKQFVDKANYVDKTLYSRNKKWTENTTKWIEKILTGTEITNILGKKAETSREYYRIDITSWIQREDELDTKNIGLSPHLWDLEAAVEHENNSKEWLDEVCKLAYIRCPLRVVIGYGTDNLNEKIKIAKKILSETNAFTDDDQEFLIILGKKHNDFIQGRDNFEHCIIKRSGIVDEE